MAEAVSIDARGQSCPWPVLRVARAARLLAGPGVIRIRADDPIASSELAELCAARGWELQTDPTDQQIFEIRIS